MPVVHLHHQREDVLLHRVLHGNGAVPHLQHYLPLTTIVNITLVQEGDTISVRSDALGRDEQVLAIGLQIVTYLSMLEFQHPGRIEVDMPTLAVRAQ